MKRYRERPSFWHVIVTCFALLYLVYFIAAWLIPLNDPTFRGGNFFWPAWITFGLILAWIVRFLIGELIRQVRLYRQWISK